MKSRLLPLFGAIFLVLAAFSVADPLRTSPPSRSTSP